MENYLEKEKGNKASPPDTSCKQIMEHILLIIPNYIKVGLYYNSDLFKQGKYPLEQNNIDFRVQIIELENFIIFSPMEK